MPGIPAIRLVCTQSEQIRLAKAGSEFAYLLSNQGGFMLLLLFMFHFATAQETAVLSAQTSMKAQNDAIAAYTQQMNDYIQRMRAAHTAEVNNMRAQEAAQAAAEALKQTQQQQANPYYYFMLQQQYLMQRDP